MHVYRSSLQCVFAVMCGLADAAAQPLGTFTWQLQPFCNKVVVKVTQNGDTYTLDGYDDQCGAAQRAPLVGLATPNGDGMIGLGFHIVTVPGGKTVSVEARLTPGPYSGPWTDSGGNSGTAVLNGAAGGAPRPAPSGAPAWGTAVVAPGGLTGLQLGFESRVPSPSIEGGAAISGVWGANPPDVESMQVGVGVAGSSDTGVGVAAASRAGIGLYASATTGTALAGSSQSGRGVVAQSRTGTALLVDGAVAVTTDPTRQPVFRHRTTAANITGNWTTIDHPMLNGDAAAMVFVTHVWGAPGSAYIAAPVGAYYAGGRWRIFREDLGVMPVDVAFNVFVVKID